MNNKKQGSAILGLLAVLTIAGGPAAADEPVAPDETEPVSTVGEMVRLEGTVFRHVHGTLNPSRVESPGVSLAADDIVRTRREAKAFMELVDDSRIVLLENSKLAFRGLGEVETQSGKVLFDIKKQGAGGGLKVTTKTSLIGVKGTRFFVDSDDERINVYLKEGRLSIEKLKGEFKRYMEREKAEFERYSERERSKFEEYKREMKEEFVEYTREFEIESGSAIAIDGSEVRDIPIPPEIEDKFRLLDEFGAGSLDSVADPEPADSDTERD